MPIHLSGSGKNTRIRVQEWPHAAAPWRVHSTDDRGRCLAAMGYHRFQTNQPVGSIQLHVTSRRPLLVTEYALADTLISGDRAEVLGDLILCAEAVARQLHQSRKIGNGCLEWQLDPGPYEGVCRLFPDFKPARKRNPLKRGKKYLRSCP